MRLREAKDAEEVAAVRAAADAVAEVMEEMFTELRAGAVEAEANAQVEYRLRGRGATAVHPLVLFGTHAAQPHGEPSTASWRPAMSCAPTSPPSSTVSGRSDPLRRGGGAGRLGALGLIGGARRACGADRGHRRGRRGPRGGRGRSSCRPRRRGCARG
jgi:hypothetical protein